MRTLIGLAACGTLLLAGGEAPLRASAEFAAQAQTEPLLAVSAYTFPADGREIQLVGLDGKRLRVDPHPPMPIDGAWSPSGSRIAFSGAQGPSVALGSRNIYTTNSRGKDVRLIYAGPAEDEQYAPYFVPSWSPDGNLLAFSVDGRGPWIVGADGRGAKRVANLVIDSGQWSAWSPDGKRLAVAGQLGADDKSYGVYTVRVDGAGLQRITRQQTRRAEGGIADVAWSPDAKRIVYRRSDFVHADEIDVVGATGRNEHRVAAGGCPVWAPNARRLAFVAEDQRGRVAGIATAGPGSSPPKLLVREKHAWCPVWSADGRRIVFFVGGRKALVADAATGKVRRPSAAERKHVELAPTSAQYWSTDGKLLDPEGDFDENEYVVRVLTLAGTSATFRWSDDHAPAWSPDGQHLAFVRLQKAEQIFVLDATTRRSRRLAAGTNPAWSPDGKWIAFERKTEVFVVPSGGGTAHAIGKGRNPTWSPNSLSVAATGGGLFVMSRDGKTRLRVDRPGSEICEGGGAAPPSGRPAWSHDGRMLAFGSWCEADQTDELAVAGSDGTFQRFIAPGNNPQWTADDSQIGFIDSTEHLAVIPAAGGAARVLDTRIVTSLALQPDGSTIAYSVDIPSEVGTEIWLVQTDGTNQRPLLQGGDDGDPAWRP